MPKKEKSGRTDEDLAGGVEKNEKRGKIKLRNQEGTKHRPGNNLQSARKTSE